MLVLSRKIGEKIQIGADVWLTVVEITPHRVRLGFDAPLTTYIRRPEYAPPPAPTGGPGDARADRDR